MSITSNPTIDFKERFTELFYFDDGAPLFACIGDPTNVIAANIRALAVSDDGNLYLKTADDGLSTGWSAISAGGGLSGSGVSPRLAYWDGATSLADIIASNFIVSFDTVNEVLTIVNTNARLDISASTFEFSEQDEALLPGLYVTTRNPALAAGKAVVNLICYTSGNNPNMLDIFSQNDLSTDTNLYDQANAGIIYGDADNGLNIIAGNAAGIIKFATNGIAYANERMRIAASGEIGINNTSPSAQLDIQSAVGNNTGLRSYQNASTPPNTINGSPLLIHLHTTDNITYYGIGYSSDAVTYEYANYLGSSGELVFEGNDNGGPNGSFSFLIQPTVDSGNYYIYPDGLQFYVDSATYYGGIGEISSDVFGLMLTTGTPSSGSIFPLAWTASGIGINKSSGISAQLHVVSGDNARIGGLFEPASATPTVATIKIQNPAITRYISFDPTMNSSDFYAMYIWSNIAGDYLSCAIQATNITGIAAFDLIGGGYSQIANNGSGTANTNLVDIPSSLWIKNNNQLLIIATAIRFGLGNALSAECARFIATGELVLLEGNTYTNQPTSGTNYYSLYATRNTLATTIRIDAFNASANTAPTLFFAHGRGTNASPTATQDTDILGIIQFNGYFSTTINNTAEGASIRVVADGNWSIGNNGAEMKFYTTANGGSNNYVGKWSDKGIFCVGVDASTTNTVNKFLVGNVGHNTDVVASIVAVAAADNGLDVYGFSSMNVSVYIARFWRQGEGTPRARITPIGIYETRNGTANDFIACNGTYDVLTTTVGNVGAGEDDLQSLTLPANSLAIDGDFLEMECCGETAANANNKTLRFYFGGSSFFDSGALAANSKDWVANFRIIRLGASSIRIMGVVQFQSTAGVSFYTETINTTLSPTLSNSNIIKATGEATSNDDITQNITILKKGNNN